MGFVLSVFYFVVYYLTPATVFGPLAAYRIELILAGLIVIVSLPVLPKSFILKTPQSLALIGLAIAVFLSILIEVRWPGGAVHGFLGFIPNAFAYYLVCLHCNSKRKLQVLVVMLLFVCFFVIGHGYVGMLRGVSEETVPQGGAVGAQLESGPTDNSYLLRQLTSNQEWIYRLKGLGEIDDPNDFAQLIVCVVPLTFIFWRQRRTLENIAFVILPVCVLLYGLYLTHSRGGLLALLAMSVVAARRRIGSILSLLLAAGLFAGAMAVNFTGGREISAPVMKRKTSVPSCALTA